ncbi:MAG TPA: hypothetical protein VFM99_10320 [Chitinophagales bacterium]|nr:hypothetical protein [Chitinophagales bacterium]
MLAPEIQYQAICVFLPSEYNGNDMSLLSESSNLVKLIKSLKQGEKRHVTLELSRYKKENNLLKLYQLIAGTGSIADIDIRKKITDKKFISQLRIHKHKLYFAVLEALQTLPLKTSPHLQVLSMIHQSYLLHAKGLVSAQRELLSKTITITRKFELRELELQVLNLQQLLGYRFLVKHTIDPEQLCEQLLKERALNQLHNQMLASENDAGTRLNASEKMRLKKIMSEALSIKTDSFTAHYYRLRVCFSFYAITGDHHHSYRYAGELIKIFKKNQYMLSLDTWRIEYIESLRNFIPAFTYFGKPKLREFIYNEVKRMDVPDLYKASITVNILDAFIQSGTFWENEKKINDIQKHIDYYKKHLSPYNKAIFYFNLAIVNFGLQKNARALVWLNELINNTEKNTVSASIGIVSRLLRLIVFYELGHQDILENYIRSTSRYIAKQKNHDSSDQFLLKLIKRMNGLQSKKKLIELMKQKKQELLFLLKDKTELRLLDYFDFISWVDSKIEQKSFTEIVKQKNTLRLQQLKQPL